VQSTPGTQLPDCLGIAHRRANPHRNSQHFSPVLGYFRGGTLRAASGSIGDHGLEMPMIATLPAFRSPRPVPARPVTEVLLELAYLLHATKSVQAKPPKEWRPRKSR
jgi:hypothetical protein